MRLTRYRFGEFELDPASRELRRAGKLSSAPLKSLECLTYLIEHRERAVGRDELVSAVWGRAEVGDTVITQTMRRARKALDDDGSRQTIVRTIPGFGYRWVAQVEVLDARSEATGALPEKDRDATSEQVLADVAPEPVEPAPPEAPALPAGSGGPRARRGWKLLGAGLVVVVGALVFFVGRSMKEQVPATEAASEDGPIVVLPVSIEPPDAELSWVRLGAMEYAASRLRKASLKVISTEQTLHLSTAFDGGDASNDRSGNDAALRKMLATSGARWLLMPRAQQERSHWRVQLRALELRSDAQLSDVRVEARGETPLRAMAVATDAWLRRIGHAGPAGSAPTLLQERLQRIDAELDAGQLEAAREQIAAAPAGERKDPRVLVREGQLEYRAGRLDAAQALFQRSLSQDPRLTDAATRAKGLMGRGAVAMRLNRLAEAEQDYADALVTLQDSDTEGDVGLLGNAYNGRGVTRVQRGNMEGAVSDLGLARVAMQQNGDVVSAAMVGSNLGRLEGIRNHWSQAVQEYDSAIDVFERYQIHDYLAATLSAKALAHLALVQPGQAVESSMHARALVPSIEDAGLRHVVTANHAQVAVQNGRLDEAEAALRSLRAPSGERGRWDTAATAQIALLMARGERSKAAVLVSRVPLASLGPKEGAVIVAVQAAGAEDAARAWRDVLASGPARRERDRAYAAAIASAVIERRYGTLQAALAAAAEASALANDSGSPDDRVRADVLRALVLLDQGRLQTATAVLGELDAYAVVDYRVAWLAWAIHKRGGNVSMSQRARQRVESLRGQRPAEIEPVL